MDRREDKLASADQGLRHLVAVATRAPFSWYVAGQAADTIGLWMQRLALGWLVWELTGSATWLGAISFLKFAPTMLLGLFGGVLADRFPRGRIVLAAQAVTVFQAATVALLIVTGDISLPILVVLTLMVGIAVGLSQAASKAVVSELVPRADVPAAIALNSVVFNVSQLAGPAIAGVVLVFAGNVACFVAVALLFATNLVVFWRILPHVSARPAGDGQPMLRAIGTALAFCLRHRGIAPLLVLHFAFTFSVRPIIDLLPAFAGGELNDGVDAVSVLTSAVGLGAIASGLYLAARPHGPGLLRLVMASMLVLGLAMLGFAAAPGLWVAAAMGALIGGGMAVRAAGVQTLVQLAATEDLRGRVLSLYGLGLNTGAALGAIGVGALADAIGLREALAVVAIASLAVLGLVWLRRRDMEQALEDEETR
jgi:predicted MFS family arabinose efflux permease